MEYIEFEGKDGVIHNITELEEEIKKNKELNNLKTGTKTLDKTKGYSFEINPSDQDLGIINIIVNEENK